MGNWKMTLHSLDNRGYTLSRQLVRQWAWKQLWHMGFERGGTPLSETRKNRRKIMREMFKREWRTIE